MLRRSALILIGLACAACHGAEASKAPGQARPAAGGKAKPAARAVSPLVAHRFAEVSNVIGPYVGRDGELALAAWGEASTTGRNLFVATIDARGVPATPKSVGRVAPELDLVLVRGFGAASASSPGQPRFAVVTTRRLEQKTHIEVSAIAASGAALWGPTALVERAARVLWLGFVPAGSTPLVLWAEQASVGKPGEPASVYGMPLSLDGKQQAPQLLVSKACVWQAANAGPQAALASVKPSGGTCSSGSVSLELLGPAAKSEKSVELGGRAGLDLDLVGGGDAFVLAWSDHAQLEPRAVTAIVDARGVIRAPAAAAIPALGEQAVVALTPGSSAEQPAFLAWENVAERPDGARYFELSALDARGRASGAHSRVLYDRADGGAPELAPFRGGVAALTLAPACAGNDDCQTNLAVPTFVALDAALKVQASQPLLLDTLGGRAADLGWGLTCVSASCFALSAPSSSPAALFTVPLPLVAHHYRAAAEEAAVPSKPRVVSSEVLARANSPLAQLALSDSPRPLVGYVTDFDPTTPWQKLTKPAEDGRLEPLRARVAVLPLPKDGSSALADEQVISLRAHSLGGLSLLPGVAGSKEQLALWTGLDNGEPQVFLTLLAETGKRSQQRMLTRKSGDLSDVAGLVLENGYLVAWVDQRSGDAEVYAARVGRSLEKAGPEQRITSANGAATDLTITRLAGKPYAVWSDSRNAEEPGWADIYSAFLAPNDAARVGTEQRLTSTRQHSFAPQVSAFAGAPLLAWLEEGSDGAAASVRIAPLSEAGEVGGSVQVVPLPMGAPRALGFECQADACHVAVTIEAEGAGELYGFSWKPGAAAPRVTRLSGLGAPTVAAVAPLVRGSSVYVADFRDGRGLLRRLGVEW